jgi:hypothetical protein
VTTRRDLTIPEGWQPRRNTRVRCLPLEPKGARKGVTGRRPEPWQPAGVWLVIDRSPDIRGGNSWWCQPADDTARTWARIHAADMVQRCVSVPGRLLVPPGVQLANGVAS